MPIELMTLAMLASAGVSAAGSIYGGIAAKRTGELNAFSTKTESILAKAQGIQQANMRNTAFKEAMSAADAAFYAAGRDIDPSVEAFKRKEQKVFGEDISDLNLMTRLNELKLRQQGATERRVGKEAFIGSLLKATATGLSAYSDYRDTR